jgi:Protein of unknown function (DUF3617)
MKTLILILAGLLPVSVALAGNTIQPLNVTTGLWQVTLTTKISALPSPTTTKYETCVNKEDLNKYPFTDPEDKCSSIVQISTGSTMKAHGTCSPEGDGTKYNYKLQLKAVDAKHVEAKGQLAISSPNGSMDGDYLAKAMWIGATCR